MSREESTGVLSAFELLLEEIEGEIELANQAGASAFQTGDYERVEAARSQAVRLTAFRHQLLDLRRQWSELTAAFNLVEERDVAGAAPRRNLGRLDRGRRTPEEAYRRPVLQALAELGGSGKVRDVLQRVEVLMQDTLGTADYESLSSNPNIPRWDNTAQWARYDMVNDRLLRDDSPRGIWELSEAGRRLLKERG